MDLINKYKEELLEKKKTLTKRSEIWEVEALIKACESYEQEDVDFYEMD